MATSVKERNGKVETGKRDIFDFLNSPPEETAMEIVRRNEGKKPSIAETKHEEKCTLGCNKHVVKGQEYYKATSTKSCHYDCLVDLVPKDVKTQLEKWRLQPAPQRKKKGKKASATSKTSEAAVQVVRKRKVKHAVERAAVRPSAVMEGESKMPFLPEFDPEKLEELNDVEANHILGWYQGQVETHNKWLEALPELLRASRAGEK